MREERRNGCLQGSPAGQVGGRDRCEEAETQRVIDAGPDPVLVRTLTDEHQAMAQLLHRCAQTVRGNMS